MRSISARAVIATLGEMMRGGGRVAHDVADIRLVGGTPAIDFVNSIHDRASELAQDYLLDGVSYLDWCVRAGVLTAAERRLVAERGADEVVAGDAPMLRAAMHELFTSVIEERPAGENAVAVMDRWLHLSWAGLHLDARSLGRLIHDAPPDASLPLQRLALSGLDTLRDVDPRRLKRCATVQGCGWLFVDRTKNGTRRWCSMATCGARDKMRRYRARVV